MSNPSVQLSDRSVTVFLGEQSAFASVHSDSPKEDVFAFAQLVMLQALVERQSALAAAMTQMAAAFSNLRPQDPKIAMEAATKHATEVLSKLGIQLPNLPR